MVQSFDTKQIDLTYPIRNLRIKDGDVVLLKIDNDKWDLNEAQTIASLVQKCLPYNTLIVLFNGMEIEIIEKY